MGVILSRFMSESEIRRLAMEVLRPKMLEGERKERNLISQESPCNLVNQTTQSESSPCASGSNFGFRNSGSKPIELNLGKKQVLQLLKPSEDSNNNDIQQVLKNEKQSKSTNMGPSGRETSTLSRKSLFSKGNIDTDDRSETKTAFKSTSAKPIAKSKSTTKKVDKALSSRILLQGFLGENAITENIHSVDITASFKFRPDYTATFRYSYNPITKTEVFESNCGKDKLVKMEIPLDKNGNGDASQFVKSLTKLSSKFEGTITVNGYKITTDADPSRRIKIMALDIRSSPMVMRLSPKGIRSIIAMRSTTKLEIRGETEFGMDEDKRIRFEGQNIAGLKIHSPEGKGLFVFIPTHEEDSSAATKDSISHTTETDGLIETETSAQIH